MTTVASEAIPTGKEVKWYHGGSLVQASYTITAADVTATKFALPSATKVEFGSVWVEKNGVWMTATLHPAALLRNPKQKPLAFEDYVAIREKIHEVCAHTY